MEKRVLFAAVLSAVFLAWYSHVIARWGNAPGKERLPASGQRQVQPPGTATQRAGLDEIDIQPLENEEVTFIESADLRLEIGKKSGTVRKATLKQFTDSSGNGLLQFGNGVPLLRHAIESALNQTIHPDTSILFLDEIQATPELFAKLRWFYEDMPQLAVIAAGSLLEFVLENPHLPNQ